ncbi:MAG TPA: IPT/TIG domain-containing protein, partial [Dehalococcoidia bacterium]|nr:IPT/TIG domain-containing protein [Dehalococcoidia bacterium]
VTISLGGAAVSPGKINFGSTVKVDSNGNFVTNLVVPINSTTLTPGSYSLSATDSAGRSAATTLSISAPTITLSPTASRAGNTITVTGANFPLGDTSTSTDQVPLVSINYYLASNNPKRVASILPDSMGTFTTTFKVPLSATIPSVDNRVSTAMPGTSATATATHSVTGPTITASPTAGTPGTGITITGTNFNAFDPVKSLSIGGVQIAIPVTLTTDASGQFTLTGNVPVVESGTQPISVVVGESTHTLPFTVQGGAAVPTPTQTVPDPYPTTYPLTPGSGPLGDNLLRVFRFDNVSKQWTFYDPQPEFAPFITLTELVTGKAYWIEVKKRQTKVINGKYLDLFEGWNLVAW